ncbi:hypothetical protein QQX98_006971 [Neonectria punicea]|uniref:Xylanolytic transcriptional activator regulatory domain-containing protein n=1 Tax=Neonectria punicea TaxID=979145 RepID=A0ABR1GZD7_9HYPO
MRYYAPFLAASSRRAQASAPITPFAYEYDFSGPLANHEAFTPISYVDGDRGGNDAHLELYYEHFHCAHPFILPRPALQDSIAKQTPNAYHLVAVMRHIGSFYADPKTPRSDPLHQGASDLVDGFTVQTTILLALAKSMCSEQAAAEDLLAQAIEQTQRIGMNTKSFADTAQISIPVLAESWRRTWWMLYLVDAHFSVIRRDYAPTLEGALHHVDLPCEDEAYSSMTIPLETVSWQEYTNREYALEEKQFSSFAYFIDATDIFVSSLRASLRLEDISKAEILSDNIEVTIAGWFVMLPPDKRGLVTKSTSVDQLMFQSHMMIYT